jgi:serine/threonine protein kinase
MAEQRFEQIELIAKGGMAEVYRARTVGAQGFAKDVCVKKILPHLTADPQFVSMFVNEAKLAATLSSANIVQVHDLCVSGDREYFIVMEYVNGRDASDIIRAAQLAGREVPPPLATYVVREMLKGLYYAHTKTDSDGAPLNVIHRDVSPQNVLVAFSGEVKLTDFGIAKASSIMNKTAVGILKGKYGYMSPEQARGEPLDARSDLFCAGIVLYELLVGERCFAGASDYSTLNLMREAQVTPPSKINKNLAPELEAIVLRALAKDPAKRYRDALEFEAALAQHARRSGTEAGAVDVTRFMRALFKPGADARPSQSTGVLALSSIAGPPSPSTAPIPAEPGPSGASSASSAAVGGDAKAEARAKAKAARAARASEAPAPSSPAEPAAPSAAASDAAPSAPGVDAAAEARAAKKAAARAKLGLDAPAGLPASDDAAAKGSAKADKKRAAENKRPIGRRDLKPGLSTLARIDGRGGAGRRAAIAIAVLLVAGGVGWGAGSWSAARAGSVSVFRAIEAERVEALADPERPVVVVILSSPPGARIRFDDRALESKTPLAIELPRDTREHVVEVERGDGETRTARFRLDDAAYRVVELRFDDARAETARAPASSPRAPTE